MSPLHVGDLCVYTRYGTVRAWTKRTRGLIAGVAHRVTRSFVDVVTVDDPRAGTNRITRFLRYGAKRKQRA